MEHVFLLAAIGMVAGRLVAQDSSKSNPAVAITAAGLARYAVVLAQDSMRDRLAPSAALDRTAQYVADQFDRLGLSPVTFDSLIFHYPVPGGRRLDKSRSEVEIATALAVHGKPILTEDHGSRARDASVPLDSIVFLGDGAAPTGDGEDRRRTVLIAGRQTAASLRQADLEDAQVLYVPPTSADSAERALVLEQLRAQSHGVIVLSADSVRFAARLRAARQRLLTVTEGYLPQRTGPWAVELWPAALADVLRTAGVDLVELRATTAPVGRLLPFTRVHLFARADTGRTTERVAPIVAGWLEGTDEQFDHNPLVISAHMDHTGRKAGLADSVVTGGDRDASEVAGLLALAEAFTRPGRRPRHSVIFLASSGGAPGDGDKDWGSNYFIEMKEAKLIGFDLALERLEPPAGDMLLVAGTQDVSLPRPIAWVLGLHPELQLSLAEEARTDCSAAGCWSERSPFARAGVSGAAINSGHLLAGIQGSTLSDRDPVLLRNAEREARIMQFVYYMADDLANMRKVMPQWNATGRQRWLHRTEP